MTNTQHTPTPWYISETRLKTTIEIYIDGWGYTLADCDASHSSLADKVGIEEVEANAAFIVKAVNCHDELLKALEGMLQIFLDVDDSADFENMKTVKAARAAIAKAESNPCKILENK